LPFTPGRSLSSYRARVIASNREWWACELARQEAENAVLDRLAAESLKVDRLSRGPVL
jgi:hypothetical protein